ncbi:M20 family metallopeptidase [Pseudactinotalea sp. Z1739]|uniref:M20 family metallopeptidase n=1 Tax=Pseudactinotalea sp. Z1739 TaxID=3413028 RepID=UPI003C7CDF46
MADDDAAAVLEAIAPEAVADLAAELITAAGQGEMGTEEVTARVLSEHARDLGLDASSTVVAPQRPNVRIITPDAGAEPGLLLLGHTDVVPAGTGWRTDPYQPVVRDGRLYGRGAADMLGGLAAALVAMGALARSGVRLRGPVELAAVVDEEELGIGIRDFITDPAHLTHAGCVVAEPTDLQTIVAARGASYIEIDVHGQAAHAGNPADGRNAIYGAAAIIADLEAWHAELAADAHPLAGAATWNVGVVTGGVGGSMVPDHCRISADRRLLPDEDPEQVLAEVRERIAGLGLDRRGLAVDVLMPMNMPGFETDPASALVRAATAAVPAAGGPDLPVGGWTAACDGGFLARDAGIPVVVLGPGSVTEQAHRPNESVALEDLTTAAGAYALMALNLLT